MDAQLTELISQVDALIDALQQEEQRWAFEFSQVADNHRHGARNLIHYAALRQHDIGKIQAGLASVGATRLSTAEPSVLSRLYAARNVLSAYAGEELKYTGREVSQAFATGDDILEDHANILFGESNDDTHSRIMVTLPTEAAEDLDLVRGFVQAGMELARINCAHDGPEAWEKMIGHVRTAASEVGREIKVSMDLAGPKVRTGAIAPGPAVGRARVKRTETGHVVLPAKIWLTPIGVDPLPTPELPGRPTLAMQVAPEWLAKLQLESEISLHDNRDAKRRFVVTQIIANPEDSTCPAAVLAEGNRNAYISNSTLLEHEWEKTRVTGIPPLEQRLHLHVGDRLILTDDPTPCEIVEGQIPRISCTLPEAVAAIEVGQRVLFDDGSIAALASAKQIVDDKHTEITLDITYAKPGGTKLAAFKGINLPETTLPLPSLTNEDIEALRFVAAHADIANISFIRDVDDVNFVLDTLQLIANEAPTPEAAERARRLGIVLKIETIPAYESLATVLLAGMRHPNLGIMIARGDLAVELGFERMAEVPRLISQMAEAAHVPTVMATQILENLAKSGLPSRAEITDAGYALRSEAVMLNKGPHITDAIRILHTLSVKLGRSQRKNRQLLRKIGSWS